LAYVCLTLHSFLAVLSWITSPNPDTRILLTLLLDQNARPSPKDMKLWVDVLRFIKKGATGGALGFFTYMELSEWLSIGIFFVANILTYGRRSDLAHWLPPIPARSN
jgi:hypothetical protein